ncbi:hypothetical protein ACVGWD_04395, partial [Enterobacter asburiae]
PAVAALLIAHSPRPGGHFRQGIFLLTKMRVIVGLQLPLPTQNSTACCENQPLKHVYNKKIPIPRNKKILQFGCRRFN